MIQQYLLKASVYRFQELVCSSKHLLQPESAVGGTWVIRQLLKKANIATNIANLLAENVSQARPKKGTNRKRRVTCYAIQSGVGLNAYHNGRCVLENMIWLCGIN